MRNPFAPPAAMVVRAVDGGPLVEALVSVPLAEWRVFVRVIVAHDDEWRCRAETAALVTIAVIQHRLLAQPEGDPE